MAEQAGGAGHAEAVGCVSRGIDADHGHGLQVQRATTTACADISPGGAVKSDEFVFVINPRNKALHRRDELPLAIELCCDLSTLPRPHACWCSGQQIANAFRRARWWRRQAHAI